MSKAPQTPISEVKRDAQGRILPGQTLNPGGLPAWVGPVRAMLEAGALRGAKLLCEVIDGTAKDVHVTKDGEEIPIDCRMKDRLFAVRLAFEFTIPKPKQEVEVSAGGANTMSEVQRAALSKLAGLDS